MAIAAVSVNIGASDMSLVSTANGGPAGAPSRTSGASGSSCRISYGAPATIAAPSATTRVSQPLLEEPFDAIVLDLMFWMSIGLTICPTVRRQGANRDAPILC